MTIMVTHYCPMHRNRNAWVPIEHLLMFEKVSEPVSSEDFLSFLGDDDEFGIARRRKRKVKPGIYYVAYSQGLDYKYPSTQEEFERSNGYYWYSMQFICLPKSVPYDPTKRLWLSPRGHLVYASIKNPVKDQTGFKVGTPPKQFRFGYAVDVREMRRQLSKTGLTDPNVSQLQRTLSDLQAVVGMLGFLRAYELDSVRISKFVEEAMPCLNKNEIRVLPLRFGDAGGCQLDWRAVSKAMSLSTERVRQIYKRALRKLRQRIRSNLARKRIGLPLLTDESPSSY